MTSFIDKFGNLKNQVDASIKNLDSSVVNMKNTSDGIINKLP